MVQLSIRARRELAIMHAADALRVLAATAIPLHLLPIGGVFLSVASMSFGWLALFVAVNVAQITLHLTLVRTADELLDNPRRNVLVALTAGTLLVTLGVAGQAIIGGVLGIGFIIAILIVCGLFDMLAISALLYAYCAAYRALVGRAEPDPERHTGFEVVLPEAMTLPTRAKDA